MKTEILYRYEINYSSEDGPTSIYLMELPVVRETDKTYFIKQWGWKEKRVSKTAHNTYAYNTKDKAKDHFIRRTNTRIGWFEYWIKECKKALELI